MADLTQETLDKINEIKEAALKRQAETAPVEQVVAEAVSEQTAEKVRQPILGKDQDWSEWNLPAHLRHLYPKSELVETQDGPRWVYLATQFHSVDLSTGLYGQADKNGDPKNLGEYLTKKMLGNEGWQISGIIPSTMGRVSLLLERRTPLTLPVPTPLQTKTELPPPTDEELTRTEGAAEGWASGLTSQEETATVDVSGAVEGE